MKVITPQPFTYKAQNRDRAVLLLHGFTGSIIDVKMLGRYLQEHGYTCHAPLYKGHGADPEQLIQTGPEHWWEDVLKGYGHLISEGYEEIAVAGISLGGVFSLKLASEIKVKAVVSMCTPMLKRKPEDLYSRVLEYAGRYKGFEGKSDEQIELEMEEFNRKPMTSLQSLQQLIIHTRRHLSSITSPVFVLQGSLDQALYKESAEIIFDTVDAVNKQIRWYSGSSHIITLGNERKQIYEDIRMFLDSIEWKSGEEHE